MSMLNALQNHIVQKHLLPYVKGFEINPFGLPRVSTVNSRGKIISQPLTFKNSSGYHLGVCDVTDLLKVFHVDRSSVGVTVWSEKALSVNDRETSLRIDAHNEGITVYPIQWPKEFHFDLKYQKVTLARNDAKLPVKVEQMAELTYCPGYSWKFEAPYSLVAGAAQMTASTESSWIDLMEITVKIYRELEAMGFERLAIEVKSSPENNLKTISITQKSPDENEGSPKYQHTLATFELNNNLHLKGALDFRMINSLTPAIKWTPDGFNKLLEADKAVPPTFAKMFESASLLIQKK